MKINIYYGGRGLIDDPTLYVINKMQEVLEELNVVVERYNLYELKNTIPTLPQTLKNVDGIILASTVEWFGIGGYMQQFLDACWLYGDKENISKIYMCPVVMATTYGEREGNLNLTTAWEILGGKQCDGVCGYIAETLVLEMKSEYNRLIEKKAENVYRTINQKTANLPASNQAVKQVITTTHSIDLTPQESEQLSEYASDEVYVQKQKEDIQELANLFKGKLDGSSLGIGSDNEYINEFKNVFTPKPGVEAIYKINIGGKSAPLVIQVAGKGISCEYKNTETYDIELTTSESDLNEVIFGRMTFQRAFMSGKMTMKGDFQKLNLFDAMFSFMK